MTAVREWDIINQLEIFPFTRRHLGAVFERAVVFEPEELEERAADTLGLDAAQRERIRALGGVVFLLRGGMASLPPQSITAGWLRIGAQTH